MDSTTPHPVVTNAMETTPHPAVAEGIFSPGAWALISSNFSPYAKETLAKVVHFVIVSL